MDKMINYIFNNLNRLEVDLRNVRKMVADNKKTISKLSVMTGVTIITLTTLVHSNVKQIEQLEAEINELKAEIKELKGE